MKTFSKINFLAALLMLGLHQGMAQRVVKDDYGAIIRGDSTKKEIALVILADQATTQVARIQTMLATKKMVASFFFTGNFLTNQLNRKLIPELIKSGHTFGACLDQSTLLTSRKNRDSLLVQQHTFTLDLLNNLEKLKSAGVDKASIRTFAPAYQWYNAKIVAWSSALQVKLINGTPGIPLHDVVNSETPQLTADQIFQAILAREKKFKKGLNGFIFLIDVDADQKRSDPFYVRLESLLSDLKKKGYKFVSINTFVAP